MGKKSKDKDKLDPRLLGWLAEAYDEPTDHERVAEFGNYFERPENPDDYARAVLALHADGIIASWLRATLGEATDDDVAAIVEFAATTPAGRTYALAMLKLVADRIAPAELARAIPNIQTLIPYDAFVLGARASISDPAMKAQLDERAAFIERNRALITDATGKREEARDAANLALTKLTGSDRIHAAVWLQLEGDNVAKESLDWAQRILLAEPTVSAAQAAYAIGKEIGDDDEARERLAALTLKRAVAILEAAVERDWGGAARNLAKGAPATFHDEAGFAAFVSALETPAAHKSIIYDLFSSDASHWGAALDDAQAAIVARHMVKLLANEDEGIVKHVNNACHYVGNKGCIPVWREALAGTLSDDARDAMYTAVYQTDDVSAEDLLIDRLFVETEGRRHLIFAYNKRVPGDRQAEVLARIEKEHSFDSLWTFVGCQVSWAHHPRNVLAGAELALKWTDEGAPDRRAFIMSKAVEAAIELHRYDLARQCLAALGKKKKVADPTEAEPSDSVLEDDEAPLDDLRAKKLDAKDDKLLEKLAKARAENKPRAVDADDLAALAKTKIGWVIHRDEDTHETWFFDREFVFFYYDGFGLAAPPFAQQTFNAVHGYDRVMLGLGAFCADWATTSRSFHEAKSDFRYVLHSGNKLLMRFSGHTQETWDLPFGITFPTPEAAARAFAALDANPLEGFKSADPFYVEGKRGGTRVYEYGNSTEYGFVAHKEFFWGDSKWGTAKTLASHEAAVAAFDGAEADALRRSAYPRKIELEDRIRPLDDMPLTKWLSDRLEQDLSAAALLEGFAELESVLAVTGIDFDYKLTLGPPATVEEVAGYPEDMRAMWNVASTVKWKVGEHKARLLSPAEVVAGRDKHRKLYAKTIKPKVLPTWGMEFLDAFILGDDEVLAVYDVRNVDKETWRDHGDSYGSALAQLVGRYLVEGFVDALIEEHPDLKKLDYGQSIHDAKPKKKKKR